MEGTQARAPASARGHSSSADPFGLRGFRGRGAPRLALVPAPDLDGKEGVNGSSPLEGSLARNADVFKAREPDMQKSPPVERVPKSAAATVIRPRGDPPMRERVAIVFMTLNVMATLALGGAIAYDFSHSAARRRRSRPRARSPGSPIRPLPAAARARSAEQAARRPARRRRRVAAARRARAGRPARTSRAAAPRPAATLPPAGRRARRAGELQARRRARDGSAASSPTSKTQSPQQAANHGVITVGGIYDETGPDRRDGRARHRPLVLQSRQLAGRSQRLQVPADRLRLEVRPVVRPSVRAEADQPGRARDRRLAVALRRAERDAVPDEPGRPDHRRPRRARGVRSRRCRTRRRRASSPTAPRSARMPARSASRSPGVIFLNANFIQPVEQSFLNAMKAQGITPVDVETVDATKADYTDIVLKFQTSGAQSVAAFVDPFSYARLFQAMERQNFHVPVLGGGLDKASANRQYGRRGRAARSRRDSATPVLEYLDHQSTPAIAQYLNAVHTYFPGQFQALDSYTHLPVAGRRGVRPGGQEHRQRARDPRRASSTRSTASRTSTTAASRSRSRTGPGTTTRCTASSGSTTSTASGGRRPAGTASDDDPRVGELGPAPGLHRDRDHARRASTPSRRSASSSSIASRACSTSRRARCRCSAPSSRTRSRPSWERRRSSACSPRSSPAARSATSSSASRSVRSPAARR